MPIPFLPYAWAATPERMALAAGITVCFALLARAVRGVSSSGAVGGGLACLALFVGAGRGAFAVLTALFAVTWVSTRLGYRRKQELGLAERREGRNATQVLANLAVAAACALVFAASGNRAWILAAVAALAEAATDTVASEIGQSRRREAWMITTGKRVPAGTDGGVTPSGTLAGLAAGIHSSNLAVVDPARQPVKPAAPDLPLYMAITLFAGLWLAVGAALLAESLSTPLVRTAAVCLAVLLAGMAASGQAPTPSTSGLPTGVARFPQTPETRSLPNPKEAPTVWNGPGPASKTGQPGGGQSAAPMAAPIGPGDSLEIGEYHTPEFRSAVRVSPAGTVTLPMIGEMQLGGLDEQAAARAIAAA